MSKLRECPFMEIGEELEHGVGILPFRGWFSVDCMCGAVGPKRRTEQEAKEAWNTRHTPKHETVSEWEKRTGETYPNDGPVWSRWKTTHKDYGHWFLITNGRAQDELETEVYNKERYIIIVANHHGKPEDV